MLEWLKGLLKEFGLWKVGEDLVTEAIEDVVDSAKEVVDSAKDKVEDWVEGAKDSVDTKG